MTYVLLADNDRRTRDKAAAALRLGGYRVKEAKTLLQAGSLLRRGHIAAVIVDPAADDPATVVTELRTRTESPIIVISAREEEADKVAVLDAGADDYLTKPFGYEELLARLRVQLRRTSPREVPPITTAHFTLDIAAKRLQLAGGQSVRLTPIEWRIVEMLASRPGHLVSQQELLLGIWGPKAAEKSDYLRVNMVHIRAKVEPEPSRPRYFLTAPGLGLRFDPTGGAP